MSVSTMGVGGGVSSAQYRRGGGGGSNSSSMPSTMSAGNAGTVSVDMTTRGSLSSPTRTTMTARGSGSSSMSPSRTSGGMTTTTTSVGAAGYSSSGLGSTMSAGVPGTAGTTTATTTSVGLDGLAGADVSSMGTIGRRYGAGSTADYYASTVGSSSDTDTTLTRLGGSGYARLFGRHNRICHTHTYVQDPVFVTSSRCDALGATPPTCTRPLPPIYAASRRVALLCADCVVFWH